MNFLKSVIHTTLILTVYVAARSTNTESTKWSCSSTTEDDNIDVEAHI